MSAVTTKTILNNPVFLNPLAYYVFPQLYNMASSSGNIDHSIEKAIYSGRLSIIIDSGNIDYQINANSIEFTANGDCVFTIIQNTDEGSCVLGRWNVHSTGTGEINAIARYSTKGRTNQDINREILPDLTGNRHDIILKNFNYGGESGFNGYTINFNSWIANAPYTGTCTDNKFIGNGESKLGRFILYNNQFINVPSFKIKVTGLLPDTQLRYRTYTNDVIDHINVATDGEYVMPASTGNTVISSTGFFGINFSENGNPIIIIEQIPLYPDGLLFDGIDDYGICNTFPELNDYTLICKREWFEDSISRGLVSKRISTGENTRFGAFAVESNIISSKRTRSFGYDNNVSSVFKNKGIIVQTSDSYNKSIITRGDSLDTEVLITGGAISGDGRVVNIFKGVIYDLIIYNKKLTEEEIQKEIKKYNL